MSPASHDDDDEQHEHERDSRVPFTWILLISGAIFLAYVLSVGPAVRLIESGRLNEARMEMIYAPLIALSDRWSLAGDFFEWYCDLWRASQ